MTILEYINYNWDKTIRINKEDEETLIGLPYPYTVPCADGTFQEMYYWDTYFTNQGLKICGRYEQVKNNTNNMLYLVKCFGFMPNGNRTWFLDRSQPPFLSLMVRDVYEYDKDKKWLKEAYEILKIEYGFWQRKRMTCTGLNQYGASYNDEMRETYSRIFKERMKILPENCTDEAIYRHFMPICESGWDITPRWGMNSYDFIQPELNSLLFAFEKSMGYFATELAEDESVWAEAAARRVSLMKEFLLGEDGLYYDYNFKTGKRSSLFSAAAYFPLFVGCASQKEAEAAAAALYRIEKKYGIAACEKNDVPGDYQWNYPNGWAPLHYIVINGLLQYGYKKEALRIAGKYKELAECVFKTTNNLWEKYNVAEGSINVTNEYEIPPMMGWTAGVYLYCDAVLNQEKSGGEEKGGL